MSELWRRLRMLLSRERFERELEEEIQSHLEMQTGDNQEHGMAPEEARYAARRQFGNAALLKEVSADAWGWRWFEALAQDLRYALRTLRRRPGFTAIAILSLALGIGVNIAIFSFINGVLLRPLPVPEAERMVSIYHRSSKGWLSSSSYPDYTFYRNHNDVFTGMLAYLRVPMLLRTGEVDEKLSGELVSSDYFSLLGLKPVAGRWFGGERGGSAQEQPLVILSYDFWQRRYGHDSAVIGRSLRIGAGSFTVSGVAPPGFHGLVLDWGDPPEFWVPMRMYRQAVPAFRDMDILNYWGMQSFLVAGRLRPGVSFDQAQAALAVLSSRAAPLRQSAFRERSGFTPELYPARRARFWPAYRGSVTGFLALLAASVGLILLIACLNLANLLLARTSQRRKEIAIRMSIGSGRGRLIRQFLTESLVLSLLGGAAGLLVARWTAAYLTSFHRPFKISLTFDGGMDVPVLTFALLLSVATGVLFGMIPAAQASGVNMTAALKADSLKVAAGLRGIALRDALVIAQVALSALLLAGAGLFLRTVENARAEDVTLDPGKVLVANLDPTLSGYDAQRRQVFYSQLLDRVKALPGVAGAALIELVPLGGFRGGTEIIVPAGENRGGSTRVQVDYNAASPGYFETVGLPLVRGRAFTEHDRKGAPGVAVINEVMAGRFWPGLDPSGRRFSLTWREGGEVEVVGVVRDGKFRNFRDSHRPCFYVPLAQHGSSRMSLEVRSTGDPMNLVAAIRGEVRALDAAMPVTDFLTLQSIREQGMSQERLIASLLTGFGVLALVLAAIGVYGVTSFSVIQRTREIGIRMALGAKAGQVAGTVLRRSAALALSGLAIGWLGALALGRLIAGLLYGVSAADPAIFAIISSVLLAVAMLAAYFPARRAASVDPMTALRYE
ncbi:MAG: ABC transporter permease [Acidobacteria bacterium]|nr:ABC transporter permease [Acidobacteriota bacterium]